MASEDSRACCRQAAPPATSEDDVLWLSPAPTSEQLLAISSNLLLGLWWGKRDGGEEALWLVWEEGKKGRHDDRKRWRGYK